MQCSRSCEPRWCCVECSRRGEGCYEESGLRCLQEKVYVERRSYAGGRRAASTGQQGADWLVGKSRAGLLGGRRHAAASLAVRSSEKQPARARPHSLRPIFACHRRPLHHFPPCVRECSHALLISLRPVDLLAPRSDRAQTTKTNDTTSDDDAPTSLPYPPQHHLSSRRCYSPAGTHAALHAVYPHSL
jgi:hypothetical protein